MKVTRELIESVRTGKGGWKYKVLRALGVSTPPKHGWMKKIIGTEISDDTFKGYSPISPRHYRSIKKEKRMKELSQNTVYFIGAWGTEFVKIGKTISVEKRIKGLQGCCPIKLVLLGTTHKYTEKEVHCRFKKYRRTGEWFIYNEKIKQFILTECDNFS